MNRTLRAVTALLGAGLLAASSALAQTGRLPWEDFELHIKARQSVTALSADGVLGDHVDLYSGVLSFSATDLSLPGNSTLPVGVSRKFTVTDRHKAVIYPNGRDYAFAEWDLDLPRISGTFAPDWHNNRCTVAAPPTVKEIIDPSDYWGGNTADMPGGGEMLRADVARPQPTTGGPYLWLTSGDTYFSCLPNITNGSGEGFFAITKEGLKYWFNHMAQYAEPDFEKPRATTQCNGLSPLQAGNPVSASDGWNLGPGGTDLAPPQATPLATCINYARTARRKNVLYPTRVEDRFGNWVSYTYTNAFNQPVRISQIDASDGRRISFQYNASGYISAVSDGLRTWTYQYNGDSLSAVNLPDGSYWLIDFAALSDAEIEPSSGDASAHRCTTPQDWISGDISGVIRAPSGAKGTFTVGPRSLGRTNVPLICSTWSPPSSPTRVDADDFPVLPYRWPSLTLKRKVLEGPGLAAATWNYGLSGSAGWVYPQGQTTPVCANLNCLEPICLSDSCAGARTATITEPDGSIRSYVFGNSYRYNEGKLLRESVSSAGGAVLRSVAHTYNYATSGQPYAPRIGTSPQTRGDGFTSEYPRPLLRSVTSQQDANFSWAVGTGCAGGGLVCLDELMRPTRVDLSSTASGNPSRTESYQYHDNKALWVMGQRSRVTVGSLVPEEITFNTGFALPEVHKAFGIVQQTLGWDTTSTVSSGQRGTLLSVADGKSNTTVLSSWHRGIPRAVRHPDLSTESAVVNNQGWITQLTDENGYATAYGHDAMGRINRVTPPGGFTNTTVSFAPVAWDQYGLSAGHWTLTQAKGAARTVTYYDALWRAVMTRSFDANSEASTRKVAVKAFDFRGNLSFESYLQRDLASVFVTSPGRRMQYDALGRNTSLVADSELGALTTRTAYLSGFLTQITNPRQYVTTQAMWALDKPEQALIAGIAAPESVTVGITRDSFGKPTSINRGGVTRRYVYDAAQRLCKTLEPEVIATVQAYDAAGNVAWRAPGVNLPGTTTCDDTSVAAGAKISHSYDARNRLLATSYGDGSPSVTRSYWPDGKLKTVAASGASSSTWTYAYNALRQPTSQTLSTGGTSYVFAWDYNADGNLSLLRYPGGINLAYNPNALGEPTTVGSYATGVKFHPNGAVSDYVLGNGLVHWQSQNIRGLPWVNRDAGVLLLRNGSSVVNPDATVLHDQYSYDGNGNVTGIADQQWGGQSTRTMGYDGLDRLLSANAPGVWGNASYTYSQADNLLTANVGSRAVTLTYNAKNLLSNATVSGSPVSYSYDPRGNITGKGGQSFGFDLGNRLYSSSQGGEYAYDGHGRRIRVVSSDGSTRLQIYGLDGQLLWSTDAGGGRPASATAHIHLGGKQIAEWNSAKGVQYTHTDALGSPVGRTNAAGELLSRTRYEAYGWPAAGAEPGPANSIVGFTGHVQDPETDLVYMQQRYYDPIVGRFLSVDPVTTDAKSGGHFGRYHYAENNPYRYVDPDGRDAVAVTFPDYRISFRGTSWSNLGHAGALLINPANGVTRYYDFGRYGGTTGIVRNLPLSNNVVMSGGVPTTASLAKVLTEVSKLAGNGGRIEGAYFSGANFSAMNSYAQGLVGKTAGNGGYGEWSPLCSCNTFQRDILQKGGVDTPSMLDPRPNSYIKELQGAPGAQSFGFGSGGFQGVFRVSGRIESKQLDKEFSR